jgi:tRNA dimethylallyltransferase
VLSGDVEGMKLRARQLARRQLTWMRKLSGVQIVDATGRDARAVAQQILTLVPPRA